MDRRTFLRSTGLTAGAVAAGGVLGACGAGGPVPSGDPTLNMVIPAFPQLLTGDRRRVVFSLTDLEGREHTGSAVEVFVTDTDGEVLAGPFPTDFFSDDELHHGFHRGFVDLPVTGPVYLVAVDGGDHGEAAVDVVTPGESPHPVPGDEAVAVRTPTVDDPGGMAALCTADPDCGMHGTSLDQALASGTPTVLLFATPAYCQTAVCAPSVAHLDEVRTSREGGDLAFVHMEIYTDEGTTVADAVHEWGLPSEPWLYTIDGDGRVVERLDGPMVAAELTEVVERLAGRA